MTCLKCERQVPERSIFCLFCGQPITSVWKPQAVIIDVKQARRSWPALLGLAFVTAMILAIMTLGKYLPLYLKSQEAAKSSETKQISRGKTAKNRVPEKATESSRIAIPESYVSIDGGESMLVYTSASAFKERSTLQAIDRQTMAALLLWGEAFLVESNTRVSVLSRRREKVEIQITSGKYTGRTGWVSKAFVH